MKCFESTSKYLTDDWCSCEYIDNKLILSTPTTGLHITNEHLAKTEFSSEILEQQAVSPPLGDNKIFIPHSHLKHHHTPQLQNIEAIIALDDLPAKDAGSMVPISAKFVAKIIVTTASHYPYYDNMLIHDHIQFWDSSIANTKCYRYRNKNSANDFISENDIIRKIHLEKIIP